MNTLDTINRLANERFELWRKAGSGGLSTQETYRVQQITAELDSLWDTYRREIASGKSIRRSEDVFERRAA
jgi:hypothetical protein